MRMMTMNVIRGSRRGKAPMSGNDMAVMRMMTMNVIGGSERDRAPMSGNDMAVTRMMTMNVIGGSNRDNGDSMIGIRVNVLQGRGDLGKTFLTCGNKQHGSGRVTADGDFNV